VNYDEVLQLLARGKWIARMLVPPDAAHVTPIDRTSVFAPDQARR